MQITPETLTWPFQDPEWKNKFVVGSALVLAGSLIPIVGWLGILVVYGYALIIMRAALRGEPPTLPKWENFGDLFVDGLKAALSAIGYFIPGILSFCCAYLFLFGSIFGTATLARTSSTASGLSIVFGQLIFFALFFLGLVFFYVGWAPTPIATAQYARTGDIASGYRLGQIWAILRANPTGFLLAWIIYLGLAMVLSYLLLFLYFTIILCFLLPVVLAPVSFYLALLWANLFGMAYRECIIRLDLE